MRISQTIRRISTYCGWPKRLSQRDIPLGALCLPAVAVLGVIVVYPVVYALRLSLHHVELRHLSSGNAAFIGLRNYEEVLRDGLFWTSLGHTMTFTVLAVMFELLLGLGLALGLNEVSSPLVKLTEGALLLPWAVPPVANALLWRFFVNPAYGYANIVLKDMGIIDHFVSFLGHPVLAFATVLVAYVWRTTPFCALVLYAGLKNIPASIREAAKVDGAGWLGTLRFVLVPMLRPQVLVLLVLRTSFALLVFDEIFAMTDGGPGRSTWVAAWYSFQLAFQPPFQLGRGAAASVLLACLSGVAAVVYIRVYGGSRGD